MIHKMKPKPIWNCILLFAIIFVMLRQMDFSSVWAFCQGDISVMLTFQHEDILTWGHYVTRTFWLEDIPVAECQWVWRGRGEIGYYHRSSKVWVKPSDVAITYHSQVQHREHYRDVGNPKCMSHKGVRVSPRTFILINHFAKTKLPEAGFELTTFWQEG